MNEPVMNEPVPKPKRSSLSRRILVGLFLGLAVGVFFGELCKPLGLVGDAFVGLLQMTVLPYIVTSLMASIGKLSIDRGLVIVLNAAKVLIVLLSLGVVAIIVLPLSFPELKTSPMINATLVEDRTAPDLLELFIPSNPFQSLAANMVPAVVLFSILLGIGLMGTREKGSVIKVLDVLNDALIQVNRLVVKATPIGVFAIAASTAGTTTWEELGRIQTYVITYTLAVLLLSFWVIPVLISTVTPFQYREIFSHTKATLLTIFATGKIIVVLPQLIENTKELVKKHGLEETESESVVDVLYPLAYPFPNLGTFVIFVFVPFAAWYTGQVLALGDWAAFLGALVLNSFVAPVIGIPQILDLLEIPDDTFNLFVMSTVFTDRIRVVLGAIHLLALNLICVALLRGCFRIHRRKALALMLGTVALFAVVIGGSRWYYSQAVTETRYDRIVKSLVLAGDPVEAEILEKPSPNPDPLLHGETWLGRIHRRGVIRIGCSMKALPYSYLNRDGDLVGFDIDLAHALARDLGVRIEFVPIEHQRPHMEQLRLDHFDLAMSSIGLSGTPTEGVIYTRPYSEATMALIVRDHRDEFSSYASVAELESFRVGYAVRKVFAREFQSYFPAAEIVPLETLDAFFTSRRESTGGDGRDEELDAMLLSAELGYAYTLLYPEFQVVNPMPYRVAVPLVFPVSSQAAELQRSLSDWIEVRRADGTIDRLYHYWILGQALQARERPWSVIRNVLGWVD